MSTIMGLLQRIKRAATVAWKQLKSMLSNCVDSIYDQMLDNFNFLQSFHAGTSVADMVYLGFTIFVIAFGVACITLMVLPAM